MHNAHTVRRHVLFWRQALLVERHYVTPVRFGAMLEPFKAKAG
jgi:hypothetical protein